VNFSLTVNGVRGTKTDRSADAVVLGTRIAF
jgi:hypothetical protein